MGFKETLKQAQLARDFLSCFQVIYDLRNDDNPDENYFLTKILKEIKQLLTIARRTFRKDSSASYYQMNCSSL